MRRLVPFPALLALAWLVVGCHGAHHYVTSKSTAVARVFDSGRAFGFFPHQVGAGRCRIPSGGPARLRISGTCSTQVSFRAGRFSGRPVVVFTETWPWRSFHNAGSPFRAQHHSWSFVVSPSGKVRTLGDTGDFPPQYAR
jgi:hypothetical protein